MELSEFLLARIAEDQEVVGHALRAIDGDRTAYAAEVARRTGPYSTVTSSSHCGQDTGPRGTVEASPGRVLAECEAKRRIVLGCTHEVDNWVTVRPGVRENRPVREPWSEDDTAADVLTYLALPYAYHPDYREEWKP